jgi:hypothetical protein
MVSLGFSMACSICELYGPNERMEPTDTTTHAHTQRAGERESLPSSIQYTVDACNT